MDGSEVTVVVLGQKGVGKTSFVRNCEAFTVSPYPNPRLLNICGRVVCVRMVDNPDGSELVLAAMVIILFDLTNKDTFSSLPECLEVAQRVSPVALRAIVGTKADLVEDRKVSSQEAVHFCQMYSEGSQPIPYYETSLEPSDCIFIAFQEILARPLINEYIIKAATEQEQLTFAHEIMDWALRSNNANILSHLRDLGYPIPTELIERDPVIIREYLLGEYPLRVVPHFTLLELKEAQDALGFEDSELDDFDEEPLAVHDTRPTIEVTPTHHLFWKDISLSVFPSSLLPSSDDLRLTHINLSHNTLTSVPVQLFQLPHLESLDVSHNQLTRLPRLELWNADSKLQVLFASHNAISCDTYSPLLYRKHDRGKCSPFNELWCLDLSWNKLLCFPQFVLHFPLKHLNLSHNYKIQQLPVELCHIPLSVLHLDGLSLTDPPSFVVSEGTQAILHYLKLRYSSSCPWNSLRVAVVGGKGAGKTSLINRLSNDSELTFAPTKGMQVVEWKYRGGDILSFRNRWFTFDLWDFSGDPEYRFIYSCFNCSSSLHIVVASAIEPLDDMVRWLSDIQSVSTQRVPVVVVFTHMDQLKTKEQRDEFKRQRSRWLEMHNKRGDSANGTVSLMASFSQSARNLQGEEVLSSYKAPQEAFDMEKLAGEDIPLMPLVIKVHFVNNLTGDGVGNVRKTLYKVATGSFSQPLLAHHTVLKLIGQEVPTAYYHLEQVIRQMRASLQFSPKEGEQKPFYTADQIGERLRRYMREMRIKETDLLPGLKFLHHLGFVLVHECSHDGSKLVSINPQMIGYLFQRMVRAGVIAKEVNPASCYLPNSHLFMLWGVDPVWSTESKHKLSVTPQSLLDFLYNCNVFSPLLPGIIFLPSLLPDSLPRSCDPDSASLVPRRSYFLSYLPSLFPAQLIAKIVSKLEATPTRPLSPGQTTPTPNVPIVTTTGYKLYMWRRNLFIEDGRDGSKVWVHVREGKAVGPDSSPHCGRVDVLVDASVEREAVWLRLVNTEIDQLLPTVYPTLLESPHQVEIFFPLGPDLANSTSNHGNSFYGNSELQTSGEPSASAITPSIVINGNGSAVQNIVIPTVPPHITHQGSLPTGSPSLSQQSDQSEWEILSKQSTTSTRLSVRLDMTSPHYHLIPLWECLQEAFKTPVILVNSNRLVLRNALPDLLFADLSPELLLRTTISSPDQYLLSLDGFFSGGGSPTDEETGHHVRSYYTPEEADVCVRKPAGALKTFHLQSLLSRVRGDLLAIQSLQCPYLVVPVGINFCPPSIALESAPYGSLAKLLTQDRSAIKRDVIHHISLQLLAALEFFHERNLSYHAINSDNVLVWNLDPVQIKVSDTGVTHLDHGCELCRYLHSIPNSTLRKKTATQCDFILLGLLVFEMATGKRPYSDIYSLEMVTIATLNEKLHLSVEAEHFLQRQNTSSELLYATGCQRLCLQSTMEECVTVTKPLSFKKLEARFSVCAGDHQWSPMRLHVNVECMLCSENAGLVYWASGSRGLVTGTINPVTGKLVSNVLQEAPPPESGLFANRRAKPVPIAVGRATSVTLVTRTQQLWVGTENGQMGSVYVFNLPDMRRHHHIHLKDAVLSVCAVNDIANKLGDIEEMVYRVLVGLANGTVILFLGTHNGKVLENPLVGPKLVVATYHHKPCLALHLTPDGYIWCSVGETMEVFDMKTLKLVRRLNCQLSPQSDQERRSSRRGDVIILMSVNSRGVWTVSRRSPVLRLWDQLDGSLIASFSVQNILTSDEPDITSLALHGGTVWLGTRNGYIFLLDAFKMASKSDSPLLGLQFCGEGKVKGIVPIKPWKTVTSKLEVLCSLELPDEVTGMVMSWEYLSTNAHYHSAPVPRSNSVPHAVFQAAVPVQLPPSDCDFLEQCKSI